MELTEKILKQAEIIRAMGAAKTIEEVHRLLDVFMEMIEEKVYRVNMGKKGAFSIYSEFLTEKEALELYERFEKEGFIGTIEKRTNTEHKIIKNNISMG